MGPAYQSLAAAGNRPRSPGGQTGTEFVTAATAAEGEGRNEGRKATTTEYIS